MSTRPSRPKLVIALACPYCGAEKSAVMASRGQSGARSIQRRRECLGCQRRFTTYETTYRPASIEAALTAIRRATATLEQSLCR